MENYTYLTLLIGDELLGNVLVLYYSLKAYGAKYPLRVMTTTTDGKLDLSAESVNLLNKLGIKVVVVPHKFASNVTKFFPWLNRWGVALDKLQMFGLVDFDKIVYLDADLWVWGNLDYLFDKPDLTCPFTAERDCPCSAIVVFEPGKERYEEVVSLYEKLLSLDIPLHDQLIIREACPGWLEDESRHIPYPEFTYYYEFERGDDYDKMFYENFGNIKAIHFGGEKPNAKTQATMNADMQKTNCNNSTLLLAMYRNYWNSVVLDLKRKGISTSRMKLLNVR